MTEKPVKRTTPAIIILTASLLVFAVTTALVYAGQTGAFDRLILLSMRDAADPSKALGPAWFQEAVAEFTTLGGYTVIITLTLIALLGLCLYRQFTTAGFIITSLVSGALVSSLLKEILARPRPDLVTHMDKVFTASFPSGHSMFGMLAWLTMATVLCRYHPDHTFRVFIILTALVMGALIGSSRIYLGVHWPTDVIAGWAAGIAWATSSWLIAHHINKARKDHPIGS